jgi:hypothetical protein
LITSATGTLATDRWATSRANSGVSITLSRTHRPMATRIRLARNGIRHAHALNAPSADNAIAVIAPVPSSSPIGTPICGQLAISPRRRCLPHSMDSRTDPLHSPPTAMPIISKVTISVALRPIQSPQWPKIAAPTGRAAITT